MNRRDIQHIVIIVKGKIAPGLGKRAWDDERRLVCGFAAGMQPFAHGDGARAAYIVNAGLGLLKDGNDEASEVAHVNELELTVFGRQQNGAAGLQVPENPAFAAGVIIFAVYGGRAQNGERAGRPGLVVGFGLDLVGAVGVPVGVGAEGSGLGNGRWRGGVRRHGINGAGAKV